MLEWLEPALMPIGVVVIIAMLFLTMYLDDEDKQ